MMVRKSGPKGHVALKLDLEKAYDHLEWQFIQETLEFFQIPPRLIQLIMNMLSSTGFHIMWNGTPLPAIVPSREVRQGDPLSPYLFILFLERLSTLLEVAVQDKAIHLVTFRGQIKISHLFFADDCKVVIYNYIFCWLLFRAKFDCNFIQSFVPCIYCGI